jgi:phage tail sheath protein FI
MPIPTTYPGVYIEEIPSTVRTITGVPTSITAFIGPAHRGPVEDPRRITSWADFQRVYGGLWGTSMMSYAVYHYYQNGGSEAVIVRIHNGATAATIDLGNGVTLRASNPGAWGNEIRARVVYPDPPDPNDETLYNLTVRDMGTGEEESFLNVSTEDSPRRLDRVLRQSALVESTGALNARPEENADVPLGRDPFSDDAPEDSFTQATGGVDGSLVTDGQYRGDPDDKTGIHALRKTDVFNLLVIPPISRNQDVGNTTLTDALRLCVDQRAMLLLDAPRSWNNLQAAVQGIAAFPLSGDDAKNAAIFFPRIRMEDPEQGGLLEDFPASGAVAGVFARTDAQRGVWKAPAGIDASLNGVRELSIRVNDLENGQLNPRGLNCLRTFPVIGNVVWGARTLRGADQLASEWKYIPVRRLTLYIEESLYRGTQWVVFEPNDEPLWAGIRLNVGAFMQSLFRQGAFQGTMPAEAYFVKCDKETTTQNDVNRGVVNILVGFAPLRPAEFVIIRIQQMAGQGVA